MHGFENGRTLPKSGVTITLAKSAGFCFGVNRAVEMIYRLLEEGQKVCTLGPIIHNPQLVRELAEKGVRIAGTPEDVPEDSTLVIRSHGVPKSTFDKILTLGLRYEDATCPFVAKIHNIVSEEKRVILIAGDASHPEVEGICGHCAGRAYVFKDADELENLLERNPELREKSVAVTAQTTYSVSLWEKCLIIIKKVCTNAKIFDTICNATSVRQREAEKLSRISDFMLVIGGKESSNTAKLYQVCRENCPTLHIEGADELSDRIPGQACKIAVTAGASTPAVIIEEVLFKMSEILENGVQNNSEGDVIFQELLDEYLKNTNTDEKVFGIVIDITPSEVYVEVEGRKQTGVIPVDVLSNEIGVKPEDIVGKGDRLELLIMKTNDQEGIMTLSKKRVDAVRGWDTLTVADENHEVLTGVVRSVVKGGIVVISHGVRVFVPASLASDVRMEDFSELIGKTVEFRLVELSNNKGRKRAVGSIRAVLREQKKAQAQEFWATAEVGKEYSGTVKSLTAYGAFVDLGGVDGMVHVSELSWSRIKTPADVLTVGDVITVRIKDINLEKKKISLGYKKLEDNPWEILRNDYPVGTTAEVQIVGLTDFGAFARIIPGIDGLIHISQIADRRIAKPSEALSVGDVVHAKITAIDFEKRRISMSIREAEISEDEIEYDSEDDLSKEVVTSEE